jgi:class 3 adenylate cyclase/tetratricopeptide (TPR) repeat protein
LNETDPAKAAQSKSVLTFLFTDIESSTPLWELHPQEMAVALRDHDRIINDAIDRHGGVIVSNTGDGVFAQFAGGSPIEAALFIQRAVSEHEWPLPDPLRVRVGLHAVETTEEETAFFRRDENAFGPAVIRAARVMDSGWGGQIVSTVAVLDLNGPFTGLIVESLGEHLLKGIEEPVSLVSLMTSEIRLGPFPPPRTQSARFMNLPIPDGALIGRDQEQLEILDYLVAQRVVTIIGPGGIGKTRLAIGTAEKAEQRYRHGTVYVESAGIDSSSSLMAAVEGALNRHSAGSSNASPGQLVSFLASREILLVFDNVEPSEPVRSTFVELLKSCPGVAILTTSRERLRIVDEWLVNLGPISSTSPVDSANSTRAPDVEIFVQAAARAGAKLATTPHELVGIERLVRLCGGIPLALELAAASVISRSPSEVADELEGSTDTNTLNAVDLTFGQFWDELGNFERNVVSDLAVFDGPFTRDQADEIAHASPFLLNAFRERAVLGDRSALNSGDLRRFQLHPIFRSQAARRQDPSAAERTSLRYAQLFGTQLALARAQMDGPRQPEVVARLSADLPNVRGAWRAMVEHSAWEIVEPALDGLFRLHEIMGWFGQGAELLRSVTTGLEDEGRNEPLLGRALSRLAVFDGRLGDAHAAYTSVQSALEIATRHRDNLGDAFARLILGRLQLQDGHWDSAEENLAQAGRSFEAEGDVAGAATCALLLARCSYFRGELAVAAQRSEGAIKSFDAIGDPWHSTRARRELALAQLLLGEHTLARSTLLETITRFERLGDRFGWAETMQILGYESLQRDDYLSAESQFEQSLAEFRSLGVVGGIASDLDNLAIVAIRREQFDVATTHLRECITVAASAGMARIVLDACIGVIETLVARERFEDSTELLAAVVADPRLDRSDSAPRIEKIFNALSLDPEALSGEWISEISDLSQFALARLDRA